VYTSNQDIFAFIINYAFKVDGLNASFCKTILTIDIL